MIYLIETTYYNKETEEILDLLKIGYTKDSVKEIRFAAYKMHNPGFKLLYEIPDATEDHEKRVQYKFKSFLFPDYGREWFTYSEEIINFFRGIRSLEELEFLPKNPGRDDREFKRVKKEVRNLLSYILEFTKEEIYSDKVNIKIEEELKDLISTFGDTLSEEMALEYYKEKYAPKIEKYLQIKSSNETGIYCENNITNQEVSKFMEIYFSKTTRYDKLKLLCEYELSQEALEIILAQISDSDEIKSYYTTLGPQKLRALSYDITRIRRAMGIVVFSDELLLDSIYSNFKEGEKYILSNLKTKLGNIYSSINYQSTPKANDLLKYFELRLIYVTVTDENTGKRKQTKGYELLKSREKELREELKHSN